MNEVDANEIVFLEARRATLEDVGTVEAIRRDAESRGPVVATGQWQYDRNRKLAGQAKRVAQIQAGTLWVVTSRFGTPIASFCVDDQLDPEFWSDSECSDALTLHGTAVVSAASGYRVGSSIHDFAGALARKAGKQWLRLDAWKSNTRLHGLYLRDGFELVRIVDLPHRDSGALFQRPADMSRCIGPSIRDLASPETAPPERHRVVTRGLDLIM